MKLLSCLILGAGVLLPVVVSAHPPRPEEAVERLGLNPELREQVRVTLAAARARHEALRKTLDAQRAANDAAFCAIRSETQSALAKLLSPEQMAQLNAAMRPPRGRDEGRRGPGRGAGDAAPAGELRRRHDGGRPGATLGGGGDERRPPPPPRCDDASAHTPVGE